MMKTYAACLIVLTALLAGCASREQIARQAAIPPYPEPYRAALQAEFRMLADREAAQNDHSDAKRFMLRAEEAARAVTIWPFAVDDYDVEPAQRAALDEARSRLTTLFDGGRARAPEALARAHAAFECWLEEAEEGHQPQDIAWCRARFEAGVAETRREAGLDADWGMVVAAEDGHVGAVTLASKAGGNELLDRPNAAGFIHEGGDVRDAEMTARENTKLGGRATGFMPAAPKLYTVYFASGSDRLDAESQAAIDAAAADAAGRPAPDVEILGFTDRAGTDAANYVLSDRRATAVLDALRKAGVAEDAFLVYPRGENAPAVATADGMPEPRNRRVEITVR